MSNSTLKLDGKLLAYFQSHAYGLTLASKL